MKGFKLSAVVLGALLLSVPAFAQEKSQKSASEKTMSATGVVSAVAADSLTIKSKGAEVKFAVDKDTHVQATGASRKTAALKSDQKAMQLTEYVKVGDSVTVKYHDTGATKHASDVVVRSALPGTKK
jgi:hypothetical protein